MKLVILWSFAWHFTCFFHLAFYLFLSISKYWLCMINISGAKFEKLCFKISRDILYSVFSLVEQQVTIRKWIQCIKMKSLTRATIVSITLSKHPVFNLLESIFFSICPTTWLVNRLCSHFGIFFVEKSWYSGRW